jgi:uncharacterized membrane protein YGL010W
MPSLFRPAEDLLIQYARYHRDPRNIATHAVGIPLIVLSLGMLLARPVWGVALTPAWLVWLLSTLWYLTRGQFVLGLAVSTANWALLALAAWWVGTTGTEWLGWGLGVFAAGWMFQFAGHYYEGRKPAFVDDLVVLLVGPLFVTAEALFALGWGTALRAEITRRAGPTRLRDLTVPAM